MGVPNPHDTLLARLSADLEAVRVEIAESKKIDLIVVTGDLTEWALPKEFTSALRFLDDLRTSLALDVDRVAVVPGNHDVNRHHCQAYFSTCAGSGQKPTWPWFPKWDHFRGKFGRYLAGGFTKKEPWSFFEVPSLRVVIAGINSTMFEGHDVSGAPTDPLIPHHWGYIGEAQLTWFQKILTKYRERGWLRLAAVHHNQQRGWHDDDANIQDGESLARILGPNLNALLHGHVHRSSVRWLAHNVPVLATGSTGVIASQRPEEVPLQYQILQFARGSLRRIARAFVPSLQSWCADTSAGPRGVEEYAFSFSHVYGTFVKAPSTPRKTSASRTFSSERVVPLPPLATVRVSLAAVLKLELGSKVLLVRGAHRPQSFGPFGGVFKALPNAGTILDRLGFTRDRANDTAFDLDLDRDLRGYLPAVNFDEFVEWFDSHKDRELYDRCLRRELREELREARLHQELLADVDRMTFAYVRTVHEGPTPLPDGSYHYRHIEVYQLATEDPEVAMPNQEILSRWFSKAQGPDVAIVGNDGLAALCLPSGEQLAPTVKYLFSGLPNDSSAGSAFSRSVALTDAAELFEEFFEMGISNLIAPGTKGTSIQLLHRVNKRYSRSLVGALEIDGRPCIVKYYPDDNRYLQKEAWALDKLSNIASVPRVLEQVGGEKKPSFMILERLSGIPMSTLSVSEQTELIPLVIREVLKLRSLTFSKYGEIVGTYEPVPDEQDLDAYVRAMVAHWRERLLTLSEADRLFGDLAGLVNWTGAVVAGSTPAAWSALTRHPCLCHSDVKPADIYVTGEGTASPRVALLDFDNVFSFVPEFDLCKFHMCLLRQGVRVPLDEFAQLTANETSDASADSIYWSLVSVYPFMMTRLLNWAIARRSKADLDDIAATLSDLGLPPFFGLSPEAQAQRRSGLVGRRDRHEVIVSVR